MVFFGLRASVLTYMQGKVAISLKLKLAEDLLLFLAVGLVLLYPIFSLEKNVYQFRTKVGPSSVRTSVHHFASFLLNISPLLKTVRLRNFKLL